VFFTERFERRITSIRAVIWFSLMNNDIMNTPKLACQVADATLINGGVKK